MQEGKKTRKKRGGKRCCVGDCNHSTFNEGNQYTVYSLANVKDKEVEKKWRNFIARSRTNFDKKHAITGYVCDGHFHENDFDETHKMQYFSGHRSPAPHLKPTAVPSKVAPSDPHFPKGEKRPATMSVDDLKQAASKYELMPLSMTPETASKPKAKRRSAHMVFKKLRDKPAPSTVSQASAADENVEPMSMDVQNIQPTKPVLAPTTKPKMKDKIIQCKPKPPKRRSIGVQAGESFIQSLQSQITLPQEDPKPHLQEEVSSTEPLKAMTTCASVVAAETGVIRADKDEEDEIDHDDNKEDEVLSSSDSSDSEWEPSDEEWEDDEIEDEVDEVAYVKNNDPLHQKKYIIYQDQLMELFRICASCKGPCNMTITQPKSFGSMIYVTASCTLCNYEFKWESQPRVGDVPAGNLLLSSGVLFAGESPAKFFRTLKSMNISAITPRTFHNHQSMYLQPSVITAWKEYQQNLIAELLEKGEPLTLGGDGRADSPGHSAKYGTYTMMDLGSGKVLDLQIIQSNEVANSNAMELQGLKLSLKLIKDAGLVIKTLITDRHQTIQKYMRENHPDIDHMYDVWHIAKGVKKKLMTASKFKECEDIALWKKAIVNHLYWAATSTPDGDGDLMAAKFRAMANHLINKHDGHEEHPEWTKCAHNDDIAPREWFEQGSKAYDKVQEIIMSPFLKRSLVKMSPLEQTSNVEAFHYILCLWAPKLLAFSYAGFKCRNYIAALHWSENGNRPQATREIDGVLQWKISHPKPKLGEATAKRVLKLCTYAYVETLTNGALKLAGEKMKTAKDGMPELQSKPFLCSAFEKLPKEEVVRQRLERARFAQQ